MNDALLSVKNLSIDIYRGIYHGKHRVGKNQLLSSVEDISFDLYPGEILGLVGESGSGKSLTALSVTGLLGNGKTISGGSIIFKGTNGARELVGIPEKELQAIRGKEISMIFQEPFSALNPLMRVGDQIAETLTLHGERDKAKNKRAVAELMEKLKLPDPKELIKAWPHQLSGGMCQRVLIALAVICRPKLLIADEPTTALDQKTQDQILLLLKEINRELGTSILFISHDLEVIRKLCGRVLVMYCGRILEEGNTEEVFLNPAHEYTRGLLGCIPGRAKRTEDLAAIPGRVPSLEEGRPSGCPFHPRCMKASPSCKTSFPPAREISLNHKTRCILGGTSGGTLGGTK